MVLIEARRTPRPPEVGMPRYRDAREFLWHSLFLSATSGATASRSIGAEGEVPAARGRRGRPRGSGRESRATSTGRGATTGRGRTLRPGGSEPPPAPGQRGGNGGESDLTREGGESEGGMQHQGAQGDFVHPWATTKKARLAGGVGRQWLGDNEWWRYRVETGMLCMRGAW